MFKMASHSNEHKPGDVVSISQLPNRQLSVVPQKRPPSDAAAVCLSKVSKTIQSGLSLSFCCKFFHRPVSSKYSNSYRFLKTKCDSLCIDPFLWLASSDVDGCNGNKVSRYPVLSKFISYILEDCIHFVDLLYQKTLCSKISDTQQISWCKIVNIWQIFTKCETFMETIILNWTYL